MALDDGYLLDGDSIAQLRDDHNMLASMVRSPAGRRVVLYPSTGGGSGAKPSIRVEIIANTFEHTRVVTTSGTTDYTEAIILEYADGFWETLPEWDDNDERCIELYFDPEARGVAFGRIEELVDEMRAFAGDVVIAHWDAEHKEYYTSSLPRRIMGGIVVEPTEAMPDQPAYSNVAVNFALIKAVLVGDPPVIGPFGPFEAPSGGYDIWATHINGDPENALPVGTEVIVVWDDDNSFWRVIKQGKLEVACGLEYIEDEEDPDFGKLRVNNADLAGEGLIAGDDCALDLDCAAVAECMLGGYSPRVNQGCGITIEETGENEFEISVDNTALAGAGLIPEGECALAIDPDADPYGVGAGGLFQAVTDINIECSGNGQISLSFTKKTYSVDVNAGGAVVGISEASSQLIVRTADDCCCDDPYPPPECEEECSYEWTGTEWALVGDDCVGPDCECPPPPATIPEGDDPTEIRLGCVPYPPPPCSEATCTYSWTGTEWELVDSECEEDCECGDSPATIGREVGELTYVPCEDATPDPGVQTDCCPEPVPSTLHLEITGCTTASADLVHNGSNWVGTDTNGDDWSLACFGVDWILGGDFGCNFTTHPTEVCSPFEQVFTLADPQCPPPHCDGFTATITA